MPASRLYAVPPSQPADIQVLVNGVPALHACTPASLLMPNSSSAPAGEPRTVYIDGGQCAFIYSTYATPAISSITPTTVSALPATLNFTGIRLSANASDYTITVADVACPVTNVTVTLPDNSTADSEQSYNVSCALPVLPAGQNELRVALAGAGLAELPGAALRQALTYSPVLSSASIARGSFFAGTDITFSGWGFAPLPVPASGSLANRTMTVSVTGGPTGAVIRLDVLSANATSITAHLRRFQSSSTSTTSALAFRITVVDALAGTSQQTASLGYTLDKSFSPALSALAPATQAAGAVAPMNFTWRSGLAAAALATADSSVNGSRVAVQLIATSGSLQASYNCSGVTALGASNTTTTYSENVTCTLPADLPASTYIVWACLPSGCGYASSQVTVTAAVTGVSPSTSSVAGGQLVAISGSGFSSNASQVSVSFGISPCAVVSSNFSTITCVTSAAADTSATSTAVLSVVPALGATAISPEQYALTYDATATPTITSIRPSKGSTEGGTLLTLTGEPP